MEIVFSQTPPLSISYHAEKHISMQKEKAFLELIVPQPLA
jgi:hypothetical protein